MLVTTAQDLGIDLLSLARELHRGEWEAALETSLKTVNNALYLSLFVVGGLEIAIASLSVQILLGLQQAKKEYDRGNYIEATGQLLMVGVRGKQLHGQVEALRYKYKLQELVEALKNVAAGKPEYYAVGVLAEKWQFPSDHLPVGAKVGNAHVISWNLLDQDYMSWVYNDSQGLKGSMLTQLDTPSETYTALTRREELVIQYLAEIMKNPLHNSHLILAIQECNDSFSSVLRSVLPSEMNLVSSGGNGVIYNKQSFDYVKETSQPSATDVFYDHRPLMSLSFKERETGQNYQIVNAHIPGDPNAPGRYEFARYVLSQSKKEGISIGLGDLNFTEVEMQEAFAREARNAGKEDIPFIDLAGHYNTNVSPYTNNPPLSGKRIDGIWVGGLPRHLLERCRPMSPGEILRDLPSTVDLITPV